MMTKIIGGTALLATIFALQVLLLPRAVQAQGNCSGKWERLGSYAGSYDADALLNDPEVKAALSQLLGTETGHFLDNLSVVGMVDLVSCHLVIEGNAAHSGGEENAFLALDLYSGTATAGMLTAGRIRIYTPADDYFSVPLALKDWVAVVSSGFNFRFDPPANADVISVRP